MGGPYWGNFVRYADEDLLSFAWLAQGNLIVPAFYHATQAIEKYLKALHLSVVDPVGSGNGPPETELRRLKGHKLVPLAKLCSKSFPYYSKSSTVALLERFSEFDTLARYPWVNRNLAMGSTQRIIH